MSIYALIGDRKRVKKVAASLPKNLVLSLSKRVIIFKDSHKTKNWNKKEKLVKIFREYKLPEYFKLEEIGAGIFEKPPGLEEIKALIIDGLFSYKQNIKTMSFGLSFYDFDYISASFVNRLGTEIQKELSKQGFLTKFVPLSKKPYLSSKNSEKIKSEGIEIVLIKKSSPPFTIYLGKRV